MKKAVFLLFFLSIITFSEAQVGINTTTPSSNAVLDLNSYLGGTSYGGFMPPRITLAQRDLIPVTATDDGLIVFVTLANGSRCLQLFNGATMTWEDIRCVAAAPSTPTDAFSETMGTPGTTSIISVYEAANGFDNDACTFSSTSATEADVRTSLPSSTSGASGSGNIFFASGTRNLSIQGINVSTFTGPLKLQLLIYKGATASTGSELTIEYSIDGTSWVVVTVTDLPTGTGTTGWYEKVLSTTVPNTIQQIRFNKTAAIEFRIDDIKIIEP